MFKGEIDVNDYTKRANKFTELINKKFKFQIVKENAIHIMKIWFNGLHNNENTKQAEEYLISIKNFVDKMPIEEDLQAEAATIYCECYQRMLVLHARKNDYMNCKKDIDAIKEYLNIFPEDEDIYNSYINAISDYVMVLCQAQEFELEEELFPKLRDLYEQDNNGILAECLSIINANFFH